MTRGVAAWKDTHGLSSLPAWGLACPRSRHELKQGRLEK